MKVDEVMLRAYVDGELEPASREQLEARLAQSPELRADLSAMLASCLPYRAAFDAQTLPPLPENLIRRVTVLTAHAALTPEEVPQVKAWRRRHLAGLGLAAAASFAAGLFAPWRPLHGGDSGAPASDLAAVTESIAAYHALYVRETVDAAADPPSRLAELSAGLADSQRGRIFVPDLTSEGLAFKRVQRLGFAGRPLIQMVYLPPKSRPVALCVLPLAGPDSRLFLQRLHGLQVASWQQDGLAYVLAADTSAEAAKAIALRLSTGAYPQAL